MVSITDNQKKALIKGDKMTFTKEEKEILKQLVKNEIKELDEEGKPVFIMEDHPNFLAMEEKYETFLENLLKKL